MSSEIETRKALQAQLFEARKLEAIGRLTGGFAHGFNNLLTVISGNLDLVEAHHIAPEAEVFLEDARAAAARGGALIRDMMAFSQQMRLTPVALEPNGFVTGVCERTRRAFAGRIELALEAGAWMISVDPNAAEIALVNMLINARDAMGDRGTIRIETANVVCDDVTRKMRGLDVAPGRYVQLSVVDEGPGIPPKTLQRIFDPFFTTKPVGQGTGLGLSMVQGFAKQSGGAVVVRSNPSGGAIFDLYFPAIEPGGNPSLT